MAYNEFAYFYDEFNGEADYDALYEQIRQELNAHDIRDGILADLGCGTGELTLMLTQAGYDIIAGGSGNRMGQDIPKQFMHVDNCPIIIHTMTAPTGISSSSNAACASIRARRMNSSSFF